MCRRSDKDELETIDDEIETAGGSAEGRILNVVEPNAIEDFVAA